MPTHSKPTSRFAMAGLLLALAALAAWVTAGIGSRQEWWHFTLGLQVSEWASYAATLALILSIFGVVRSRPGARRRGLLVAVPGIAASLPLVAMAIQWEYAARTYPAINDISTDTRDAPVFWDMPVPTDYPGATVAALQREAYPDLTSLKLATPADQTFEHALALVKDKGWVVVSSVPEEGRIEATTKSRLYGFTDEVGVRVKPSNAGSVVDVRSRSRIGRIDRGMNAKRIRAYMADLDKRVKK
jgi:uncharacterized protein (DUF1499 family)